MVWSGRRDTLRIESNWAAAATSMASALAADPATCLMDTHSHEMLDAKLGAMDCGELSPGSAVAPRITRDPV